MDSPCLNGAGRARLRDSLPAPALGDWNSYCLMCASWWWGHDIDRCPRCDSAIFRWLHRDNIRLMESRTPLGRM